jgi:Tfp pilus assembly protein FimT
MKVLREAGYTIVEVLIVLAVTALLFTSVMMTMAGRQNRTEFITSVRDLKTQIQQTISETASGYYPSMNNFRCTAVAGAPSVSAGGNDQGTNSGCIFMGKVIQFGLLGTGGGTGAEKMLTYTAVGVRQTTAGKEVTSLAEANPVIMSESDAPGSVEARSINGGLTTLWVHDGVGNNIGAVGFISSLAQYNDGLLSSGSQQLNLMPISGSSLGMSQVDMAQAINTNLETSQVNPSGGVKVCFVSGGTDQSGLITIGSNGRQLSVTLDIKENKECL